MFEQAEKQKSTAGELQLATLHALAQDLEELKLRAGFLPNGDMYVEDSREARSIMLDYAWLVAEAGGCSLMASYAEGDGFRSVDLYPGDFREHGNGPRPEFGIFTVTWDGLAEEDSLPPLAGTDGDLEAYGEYGYDWQSDLASSFSRDGLLVYDFGYHGIDEWLTEISWMTEPEMKASETWRSMGKDALDAYDKGVPISDIVA